MTDTVPADAPVDAPPIRRTLWLVLLALLAALAVWYLLAMGRPRLAFTNRLAAPVRLTVEGKVSEVGPGQTIRVPVGKRRILIAEWEMVRPLSADGEPMGEAVRGAIVVREPKGVVRRHAESWGLDADYFAPLITNATDEPLRVVVNAGGRSAQDCRCAVRPGARRVFIGYYPLYQNSTVQAQASGGRRATFRDLGPQVKAPDGTLGLRFEAKDLRPPVP